MTAISKIEGMDLEWWVSEINSRILAIEKTVEHLKKQLEDSKHGKK